MYYQYFGLTEAPFSIAVNPRYLFMSVRHRDALAHLLYGVGSGGGFILLTGEVGTGKTTINRCLLEQLPDNTDIAIILNPALNAMELLASACDELGIVYDADKHTLKTLTDSLHTYLLDNHNRGRKTVLMIDEAQHLDFDVLEQIRLLTNLETHSEKLLQIILIGQPELAHMLSQPQLRQLNQRITARYNLEPLNLEETGAYIRHRLEVAGMTPGRDVFPAAIVRGIYKRTRGIPRLINVLCDRILLGAYGRNKTRADSSMLSLAAHEVLGDPKQKGGAWPWSAAIVVVLLAALVGWWLREYEPAQIASKPVPLNNEVSSESAQQLKAPDALASSAVTVAEPAPQIVSEPDVVPSWLLPPATAMSQLWSLYSVATEPGMPCPSGLHEAVACVEAEALTWDELAAFDRPLALDIVTVERFSATVLLLGIDGRNAWVLSDQGVMATQLAELGPLWTGRYRFLWHPPQGFTRPLSLGDESAVVARVAGLFARLDGQQLALTDQRFNAALQQRVRLFQRANGLDDDGVVGVQTLLRLNEQLDIDVTAARARGALRADAAEVVQQ